MMEEIDGQKGSRHLQSRMDGGDSNNNKMELRKNKERKREKCGVGFLVTSRGSVKVVTYLSS
jgi:hypothetical protein